MCGGHGRQSVYTITDEAPIDVLPAVGTIEFEEVGCYMDSATSRDLSALSTNMGRSASAITVRAQTLDQTLRLTGQTSPNQPSALKQ